MRLRWCSATGKRYVGPLPTQVLLEDPDEVVPGECVIHLRFLVRHRPQGTEARPQRE